MTDFNSWISRTTSWAAAISAEFGNLENLTELVLSDTELSRKIPSGLEDLAKEGTLDLAPRLKELRAEQRELNEKRDEALDDMNQADRAPFDAIQMEHYVQDLKSLLHSASFLESKTFLGTFIRRIDFDKEQVGIEYAFPIPAGDGLTATKELLNVRGDGSPWLPRRFHP